MSILHLISSDNFIAVNKTIIKAVGLEAAVIFGELASEAVYWNNNGCEDGFFYSTENNIEDKTGLSAFVQRKALTVLKELGWIEVKRMGVPAKRYIRINEQLVIEFFNNLLCKNLTTGGEEIKQLDVEKFDLNNNINNKNIEKEYIDIPKHPQKQKTTIYNLPYSDELKTALKDFEDMRKKIKKPLTERAMQMLIKKALELADNDEHIATEIFNQSTINSWQGVYALKNQAKNKTKSGNEFFDLLQKMED